MGVLVLGPGYLVSFILGTGLGYESIYRISSLSTSSRIVQRPKIGPKIGGVKKKGSTEVGFLNHRCDFEVIRTNGQSEIEVIFRSDFHVFRSDVRLGHIIPPIQPPTHTRRQPTTNRYNVTNDVGQILRANTP